MKIRPVGPELFNVDGWTDGQLIVFFRNFTKAPKINRKICALNKDDDDNNNNKPKIF